MWRRVSLLSLLYLLSSKLSILGDNFISLLIMSLRRITLFRLDKLRLFILSLFLEDFIFKYVVSVVAITIKLVSIVAILAS